MKLFISSLIISASLAAISQAAITFSGGNGQPIVMTLTSDLVIPVNTIANNTYGIGLLLPGVYSTPATGFARGPVDQAYGTPGSIGVTVNLASGVTVQGYSYLAFGGLAQADATIGVNDFYGSMFLESGVDLKVGDTITLKAGTLTFTSEYIRLPDRAVDSIKLYSNNTGLFITGTNPVPEPSAALLGAVGALALLRRRR